MRPPRHLYVHVPFCRARCDYCDFFSVPVGGADTRSPATPHAGPARRSGAALSPPLDGYVAALLAELESERCALGVRRLRTVYLGGGTPSLLGHERLERLLTTLEPLLTPRAEVSVETNPEDVTAAYATWVARRHLRVSLGVQSFLPRLRAELGRRPTADPVAAFVSLRRAGCTNLGVDLIFGIPGQAVGDLGADLAEVARLRPEHVSWYELDAPPGTPLGRRVAAGEIELPGADVQAALYRRVVRGLQRLGYVWYEVSNFALPGHSCRHNAAVWRGEPYLGLGAGAVSTFGGERRRDAPDLAAYLDALAPPGGGPPSAPPREVERLGQVAAARERLMLAARTGAVVPLAALACVIDAAALPALEAAGFVAEGGGTLRVTRKGRYVANEVCVRLFRDLYVQGASRDVPA